MTSFVLTSTDAPRLRGAVAALLAETPSGEATGPVRLPTAASLRAGAQAAVAGADDPAARSFVSLLEVGYLVASTDGFPASERDVLADLLEHATGRAVDHAAMRVHFEDLDVGCKALGRRERLLRAAAEFEGEAAREEALSFAALVALADGTLGQLEVLALIDLGANLGMAQKDVVDRVTAIVAAVDRVLAA